MKIAVSNSSPLVILSTINSLDLIFNLFDKIFIPQAVYEEVVVRGIAEHYPDANLIRNEIQKERIVVQKPIKTEPSLDVSNIHQGEFEAIHLALSLEESNIILLDDEEARIYARNLGLKVKGTLGILVENYKSNYISSKTAIKKLDEINQLLYLSADLYSKVLQQLS